jgi:hypothetical protein
MEGLVYLLCAATSLACGGLLLRGFRRGKSRLLLWCGLFFLTMTLENVTLFIDLVIVPEVDLFAVRTSVALVGTILFLAGLIWDVE